MECRMYNKKKLKDKPKKYEKSLVLMTRELIKEVEMIQ